MNYFENQWSRQVFGKHPECLPDKISANKASTPKKNSSTADKEKLARIVEMLKPASKTSQKTFAWDCVLSEDGNDGNKK